MPVIAKLYVQHNRNYGSGSLTQMHCVAENDMMAQYADSEEDKLFTRYSPQGDVKLHHEQGFVPIGEEGEKFYFMIVADDEAQDKSFPGAVAYRQLRVHQIADLGQLNRHLDMRDAGQPVKDPYGPGSRISKFSWKMVIDNPPLMDGGFFVAGSEKYWLAIYPAEKFTKATAIEASISGTLVDQK